MTTVYGVRSPYVPSNCTKTADEPGISVHDELDYAVLTRHWRRLGLALDDADFTDAQAVASIARITGGNFRLLHRLFVQIERILKINGLSVITADVVEAARSTLVIGTT